MLSQAGGVTALSFRRLRDPECELVSKWVSHRCFTRLPFCVLNVRSRVPVLLGEQLDAIRVDVIDLDADLCAGACVAVVLTQVEDDPRWTTSL